MAKTEHYHTKFLCDHFYHVYNRTVDKKTMFANDGNYRFFLKQYDHYLSAVVDTYAYCLLGNHFHLLVRVRGQADLDLFVDKEGLSAYKKLTTVKQPLSVHEIVSHQFRKLFQSYAMAFNKQQDRTGTLFQTPFKRALVDNEKYFAQLIYYIHANPQLHGLTEDFMTWPWSSYGAMLADKPTKLRKQEVVEWFGNIDGYKKYHEQVLTERLTDSLLLDDDV